MEVLQILLQLQQQHFQLQLVVEERLALILQEEILYFQQLHQQVVETEVVLTKIQETMVALAEAEQVEVVQQVVQVTHLL